MKNFLKEYTNIIIYSISGVMLVLGAYNILINVNHASFINRKIVVRDIDNDFKIFKDNVLQIENLLLNGNIKNDKAISKTLSLLKKDGVYRLLPSDELNYGDLYKLNNYFLENIINEGWISSLKQNSDINNKLNNEYVDILIKNANYLNKELLNNSNYHYDVKNNEVRDVMMEEYLFILENYKSFSSFVLELCNEDGENYD